MDCSYIAPWPPTRFTYCLAFTHSLTHSYTEGGVNNARLRYHTHSHTHRTGVRCLAHGHLDTWSGESGIEPPTFRFVDNLHEPLLYYRPYIDWCVYDLNDLHCSNTGEMVLSQLLNSAWRVRGFVNVVWRFVCVLMNCAKL